MKLRQVIYPLLALSLPAMWLLAHGVSLSSAIRALLTLFLQIAIGISILNWPFGLADAPPSERLLIGAAVGFILTTTLDQVLIIAGFSGISFSLLSMLSLFAILVSRSSWLSLVENNGQPESAVFIIGISLILGRGLLTDGWLISFGILASGLFLSYRHPLLASTRKTLLAASAFAASCFLIWALKPKIEYGNWFLHPLFTGTDDNVFSESLSYSLAHFGLRDFAASSGEVNRYHFFSLAWSGMTSRIAGLEPFVMTLHVVPLIAFGMTAGLIWSLASRLTNSRRVPILTMATLFASNSLPEQFRFFHTNTTSNTMSHVWFVAALIIAVNHVMNRGRFQSVLLTVLSTAVILAKGPYGIVLLVGIATLFVSLFSTRTYRSVKFLLSLLPPMVVPALSALVFLRPTEWSQRTFSLQFNAMRLASGLSSHVWIVFLGVGLIVISRSAGILLSRPTKTNPSMSQSTWMMLLGASLSGLVSFALDGNSAERYFLSAALVAAAPLTAIGVDRALDLYSGTFQRASKMPLVIFATATMGVAIQVFAERSMGIQLTEPAMMLVPLTIVLAAGAITALRFRSESKKTIVLRLMATTIISMTIGSTIAFFRVAIEPSSYSFTETVADVRDLKALGWLRENSDPNDLVATNRYLCEGPEPCPFDDSSMLISAIARRRVLIEGPRFVVGGRPYPEWVNKRVQESIDFSISPSYETLDRLMASNVKWFYLDKQGLGVSSRTITKTKLIASPMYENERVIIFKLMG